MISIITLVKDQCRAQKGNDRMTGDGGEAQLEAVLPIWDADLSVEDEAPDSKYLCW